MGPAELVTLEMRLSVERLAPYRAMCGGDLDAAIALYEWNAEVSAALGKTLGHLEVLFTQRRARCTGRLVDEPVQ
jgi:hypothetical protein